MSFECAFGNGVVVVAVHVNDNKGSQKLHLFSDYQERDETNNQRVQELEEELSGEFQ